MGSGRRHMERMEKVVMFENMVLQATLYVLSALPLGSCEPSHRPALEARHATPAPLTTGSASDGRLPYAGYPIRYLENHGQSQYGR